MSLFCFIGRTEKPVEEFTYRGEGLAMLIADAVFVESGQMCAGAVSFMLVKTVVGVLFMESGHDSIACNLGYD
jgi:putative Ca2+/H+ antiporter (TMEM165/GDT1 family)